MERRLCLCLHKLLNSSITTTIHIIFTEKIGGVIYNRPVKEIIVNGACEDVLTVTVTAGAPVK